MSAASRVPLRRVDPERLLHQQGEALLRRDFADQAAQDDQLRWWHNRALHHPYGIVEGLRVRAATPGGTAIVSAGVAYDLFGRELILDEPRAVNVPATSEELLLVLSYDRPDAGCDPPDGGLCRDDFVAASDVRLRWRARSAFNPADGVPLAILNEDETRSPRFSRRYARGIVRPYVGYGVTTVAHESEMRPWVIQVRGTILPVGIMIDIDTRAAGFRRTPYYFADVTLDPPVFSVETSLALTLARIASPGPERFTIHLLDPGAFGRVQRIAVNPGGPAPVLRIDWCGIEPLRASASQESEREYELHS